MEENYWKEILDGYYAISKRGDIKRLKGGSGASEGRLLRTQDHSGYRSVSLSINGKPKRYFVHRLVAMAFLGPCPEGLVVNHKDGNRGNPDVFNLEYVTQQQNCEYAGRNGQLSQGAKHSFTKLSETDVERIRQDVDSGKYTQADICKLYSLTRATVHCIVRGKTWKRTSLEHVVLRGNYKARAKLDEGQVKEIRKLFAEGVKQVELCKRFGIKAGAMHHVVHNLTWKEDNMEDPKHLGVDLKEIYEEVREPLPPPRIIGYMSRVLGDDTRYDADGNEIVEAKPAPLEKVPDTIEGEDETVEELDAEGNPVVVQRKRGRRSNAS